MSSWVDKLIHLIPFDEAGWDVFKWFFGKVRGTTTEGSSSTGAPYSPFQKMEEEKRETLEGIGVFWAKVSAKAKRNILSAMANLSDDERDAVEVGIGEMLKQIKNGIFPAMVVKTTNTTTVPPTTKGGKPTSSVTVTEKPVQKRGWDPGVIFIEALEQGGRTQETAEHFCAMLIQANPLQRMLRRISKVLSSTKSPEKWFGNLVCAITRTKTGTVDTHTHGRGVRTRKEKRKETIARALNRLVVMSFLFLVLTAFIMAIIIPFAAYKLAVGPMVAESGMSELIAGVVFWTILLLALSPVGFVALRLAGFSPARRKYFSVIASLAVIGIATRILIMVVNLDEHPFLTPLAIGGALVILVNGVYWRLSNKDAVPASKQVRSLTLNSVATTILVLSILSMVLEEQFPNPAESLHKARIGIEEILGSADEALTASDDSLFTRDRIARWCRPQEFSGQKTDGADLWMNFVYRCDGTNPGVSPHTGLPGVALIPAEALRWQDWKKEQELRQKTFPNLGSNEDVTSPSSAASCYNRQDVIYAGRTTPAIVDVCREWDFLSYSTGEVEVKCLPSGDTIDVVPENKEIRRCPQGTKQMSYRSLVPNTTVPVNIVWRKK